MFLNYFNTVIEFKSHPGFWIPSKFPLSIIKISLSQLIPRHEDVWGGGTAPRIRRLRVQLHSPAVLSLGEQRPSGQLPLQGVVPNVEKKIENLAEKSPESRDSECGIAPV
jgi:hypothetical protein